MVALTVILGVVVARLAALLYYPVLERSPALRVAVLLAMAPALLAFPLLVPLTEPASAPLRWILAVDIAVVLFKLWDLHLGHGQHGRPKLGDYLLHLGMVVFWNLSYRRRDKTPTPANLPRTMAWALASAIVGSGGLVLAFFVVDLGELHFLLDHSAKALCGILAVMGFQNLISCGRALVTGKPTLLPFDGPLLSATPAEFWRRWNRSVSQYLHEAFFKPAGGRRHPRRALVAVFLASGLLHEYIFSIALMRIQGYQLAFFALHCLAVILTARIKPKGPWRVVGWACSTLFLLATSILFFASFVNLFADLFTWHPHGAWLP